MRVVEIVLVVATVVPAACATNVPPRARPTGALEARAIVSRQRQSTPETSTRAYRGLASRTLGTHCQMYPSDSEMYDARARRCGAGLAAVLGVSRLLLEVSARAEVVPPVLVDDRLLWLDPPTDSCEP